jgi:hypothetical protein
MSEVNTTRQQLRERLNMKITGQQFKRLPNMVREEQLDKAKVYMEELQKNMKINAHG